MKRVSFHPMALEELSDQAGYYERHSTGLGERFLVQVEAAITLAASTSAVGSPHKHGTRRVFPRDFPFSIVYQDLGDSLVIIAVAAFRRKPGYWRIRR